ncbi:unnamed protein product [Caenorhabditis auriculariae]|uniref:Uncharacterized protein n=1 Tax=Caenorhabditis auriculariae TaxID=2777116 RepID=A0A8S1H862_9PELO|nr:unnamed protein product [Caenorhabditis auriculariae]
MRSDDYYFKSSFFMKIYEFLLFPIFVFSDQTVYFSTVRVGDEVVIDFLGTTEFLIRYVPAGPQKFYFSGNNSGTFEDSKENKFSSKNYQIKDGKLLIKKVRFVDQGIYKNQFKPDESNANRQSRTFHLNVISP